MTVVPSISRERETTRVLEHVGRTTEERADDGASEVPTDGGRSGVPVTADAA